MHRLLTRALMGLSAMLATSLALAQVPPYMTYSGFLEDGGVPVSSTVTAVFELFDSESVGTAVWSETHNSVAVLDGEFVVELGNSGSQLSSTQFNGQELWLQITVNGDVLQPRIAINSVPYAFHAATAGRVDWSDLVSIPPGISDGDQDTKPEAACNTNQFLRWDGSAYSCSTPAESDPQIGNLLDGRWCTSNGTAVNCSQPTPLLAEADPQVGAISNGNWCRGLGDQVSCDIGAASCTTAPSFPNRSCQRTGTYNLAVALCGCTGEYYGAPLIAQCVNGTWTTMDSSNCQYSGGGG